MGEGRNEVISLVAAAYLAAAPSFLPSGAARYRIEIGGVAVGAADLSVRCRAAGGACTIRWEVWLRLPGEAGGGLIQRRVVATVGTGGALLSPAEVEVNGTPRPVRAGDGAVPLSAAELALCARGGDGCLEVLDEESGRRGPACAREEGGRLFVEVQGVREEVTRGEDGFPREVWIPAQGTRYERDPDALVPDAAPLEVRVPGPRGGGVPRGFCGRRPDPPAPSVDLSVLPRPRPNGSSCRDQAAAYASAARAQGLPARMAVGVAQDGEGFVWHAWVEVQTEGTWVAIDPAFGQLPARGTRFTIARHAGGGEGLYRAGRLILECFGRARVE